MSRSNAWVFQAPEKMEVADFEIPAVAEDCALLRVEACGICGTDKHIYLGHAPKAPFPFIAGHEIIGTIEKLGSKAEEGMSVFNGPLFVGKYAAYRLAVQEIAASADGSLGLMVDMEETPIPPRGGG